MTVWDVRKLEVACYSQVRAHVPRHLGHGVNDLLDFMDAHAEAALNCVDGRKVDTYTWGQAA